SLLQFSKNCKKAQRILLCILKRFAVNTDSAIEVSWVVSNRVTMSFGELFDATFRSLFGGGFSF
ncbi:MAG: hypothetical protein K1W40_03115, partial [Schaedlerella sp.]|uniref:hypothetical protein n=1 Tax=Schaedlerella sp. TaxID=2676057 RepID=UPI0026310BEF